MQRLLPLAGLIGLALGACRANFSDECTVGQEQCECTDEGECIGELICLSNLCVSPDEVETGAESMAESTTAVDSSTGDGDGDTTGDGDSTGDGDGDGDTTGDGDGVVPPAMRPAVATTEEWPWNAAKCAGESVPVDARRAVRRRGAGDDSVDRLRAGFCHAAAPASWEPSPKVMGTWS